MGRVRKYLTTLTAFGLLAVVGLVATAGHYTAALDPNAGKPGETVVEIPPGANLRQAAGMLERRHLIRSARAFEWLARLTGKAGKIQPGEYRLSAAMPPGDMLDRMVRGDVVLHRITLPEGLSVREIITRLEQAGFGDAEDYRALIERPDFAERHGVATDGVKVPFEGYLFPDTYLFARGATPEQIINTLLERLNSVFTPDRLRVMKQLGWNRHQVLTLASLIEKETALQSERARISAVFHNRLIHHMRLQTDPTVIYATPDFDGDIRRRDLKRDDPYNTYRHHGLPPGPIANPGEAAIHAALFPADDTALYFVARGDGSHEFSETVESHNRAVRRHQK
ncbi:MAG: endolytic transglycosylase MltG [Leptospirillia bacterium]